MTYKDLHEKIEFCLICAGFLKRADIARMTGLTPTAVASRLRKEKLTLQDVEFITSALGWTWELYLVDPKTGRRI